MAGQVPVLSLQGPLVLPQAPSPASASSLAPELELRGRAGWSLAAEVPGGLFYIFVNRVSEREEGPELINQEGIQFGFYGHGYWSYFAAIFLFFINTAIQGLRS